MAAWGPTHANEGFTFAYDMPTEMGYAETCAAIALAFWAQRMFSLDADSRYIDVMERAIYNSSLSGISHDGMGFFYGTPLAAYPGVNPLGRWSDDLGDGHYRRSEWFFCPCCPPNISRLIASIGGYLYAQQGDRIYAQLYQDSVASLNVGGGSLQLEQRADYPWQGDIAFTVDCDSPLEFELALRIPDWCADYQLALNGAPLDAEIERGYAIIARTWQPGDKVDLRLDMPVLRVLPHAKIRQTAGQVALQRGPLIYCFEEVDNGARLANLVIPDDASLQASMDDTLFGGVTVITGEGLRSERDPDSAALYRFQRDAEITAAAAPLKAIPYLLWANRQPGEMRVWMRSD